MCDKRDTATTCLFSRDLHLTFFVFVFVFQQKKSVLRMVTFGGKGFQTELLSRLSQGLPSSFLSRAVAFVH